MPRRRASARGPLRDRGEAAARGEAAPEPRAARPLAPLLQGARRRRRRRSRGGHSLRAIAVGGRLGLRLVGGGHRASQRPSPATGTARSRPDAALRPGLRADPLGPLLFTDAAVKGRSSWRAVGPPHPSLLRPAEEQDADLLPASPHREDLRLVPLAYTPAPDTHRLGATAAPRRATRAHQSRPTRPPPRQPAAAAVAARLRHRPTQRRPERRASTRRRAASRSWSGRARRGTAPTHGCSGVGAASSSRAGVRGGGLPSRSPSMPARPPAPPTGGR